MPVKFEVKQAREQRLELGTPFHTWLLPNGDVWASFYRTANAYTLRFPHLSDFNVDVGGFAVQAMPVPDVPLSTVEHLYLNQVLPLAMSMQGALVLHGSAVEVGAGCVAFIGESGRGKSTLAASFGLNRHRCLTDDGLLLDVANESYRVLPSHPSIRLWSDSEQSLLPAGIVSQPPPIYTSKGRFLASAELIFSDVPLPLTAIYFLGDGSADSVAIAEVSQRDALMELAKNSFLLETQTQDHLRPYFHKLADLANQEFFYRLDYPRRYAYLPRVRQAVVEHALRVRDAA